MRKVRRVPHRFGLQFLSRTVFGVIHSIKDALPTFEDDAGRGDANGSSPPHLLLMPSAGRPYSSLVSTPSSVPDGFFGRRANSNGNYAIRFNYVPRAGGCDVSRLRTSVRRRIRNSFSQMSEFENTAEFYGQYFDQRVKKDVSFAGPSVPTAKNATDDDDALRRRLSDRRFGVDEPDPASAAVAATELLLELLAADDGAAADDVLTDCLGRACAVELAKAAVGGAGQRGPGGGGGDVHGGGGVDRAPQAAEDGDLGRGGGGGGGEDAGRHLGGGRAARKHSSRQRE